ncbi:HEPN domain-containing protein [Paenibacillus amylolyticus]|nr:HEPN domain-containing protein [Paenibacillus amylolyticus]
MERAQQRRDFYKDILNDFDEVTRTKAYRRFIALFKEIDPSNLKVKELENFMDANLDLHIIVPSPTVNVEMWNSKKLQDYLEKIDKAVEEENYNYAITLCYTCLEGFFKAFVRLNIPSKTKIDELNPLAKEVKAYILQNLKSNNENVPEQLINLITTITNSLSNYRNQHSDSHFDSDAEKNLAKFSRDLVNSVVRYILSFCK